MKILQLAGTSDARQLAIELVKNNYEVLTTVVTSNAAKELQAVGLEVIVGRLTDLEIYDLIKKYDISAVVDGSHPFAEEASKNAINAANLANVPYVRYERKSQTFDAGMIIEVDSYAAAAEMAAEKKGTIMLTTGSKTLHIFTEKLLNIPNTKVIARMLPRKENFEKCEQLGFPQKNIVAMQGPFSKEFNKALFQQFNVTVMITKESGSEGSVDEKIRAALELGIETILIKRPTINYGSIYQTITEVIKHLKGVDGNGYGF